MFATQPVACEVVCHPAALIRANAIEAIADFHSGDRATRILVETAKDEANDVPLIGVATVAFVAMGKLLASTDPGRRHAGQEIASLLSSEVRAMFNEYLKSEEIGDLNYVVEHSERVS